MTHLRDFLLLIVLLVLVPEWTPAAEITVDASGNCTLADAIIAANTDTATGSCPAGVSGMDTIILETDVALEDPELVENARPSITSSITIEGQGHTIDGNGVVAYVLKLNEMQVCDAGNLTLNNTTITGGNHANPGDVTTGLFNNGGGIANARCGILTLNNCTVSGNIVAGNGGGIFNGPQGIVTLNNSTISGNTSEGNGGGIYSDNGTVTLNNSTISGNTATGSGGGIYGVEENGPPFAENNIMLNNSIISGNTASDGNEIYLAAGTVIADSFNIFGDSGESNTEAFYGFTPGSSDFTATSDGTDSTALSAILSSLTDNGGLTQTHALITGSPAIDLDLPCSTGLTEDQRGESRPVGDGCDAGSFEFTSTISLDIIVDADGICTLADAITAANTDTATGGCPAGSGDDTIILQTDVTLAAALPEITSSITIEGQGYTIDANSGDWSALKITEDGVLTLNETVVTGANYIYGDSGGIYNQGKLNLTDSTISKNIAFIGIVGGIFNDNGTVMLINSTISENVGMGVGGIFNENGTVMLINSTVSENVADFVGGGICNINGTVTLINSTVSGNTAGSYGGGGGGIYNSDGTITLNNSTVSGNTAGVFDAVTSDLGYGGGGVYNSNGTVTLDNSTVSGNTTGGSGGGIFNGCELPQNSSYCELSGNIILNSSIISGNTAPKGNEVYHDIDSTGTITVDSSNLFGHSGESNEQTFYGFTPGSSDVNATSDGSSGVLIPTNLSDILSPLADNGGLTQTHALVVGSPAIDLDVECSTGLTEDQRGEPRPIGVGCDAGSFEGSINPDNGSAFLSAIYLLLLNQ